MSREIKVGLRIDGDARGAQAAIETVDSGLIGLTESEKKTAESAEAINAAFKTIGIRSVQEIRAETEKLQAALARIKSSGIVGQEQERVVAGFNAKLAALRSEASLASSATTEASGAIAGLANESNAAGSALSKAASGAAAWIGALAGFAGIGSIAKSVLDTGAAFETLETRLSSLLGSSAAAKDAMAQIKELAITTPFEVSALSDSFVKLTAFGLQPSMEQMRALSDTAATLGGGTESLAGVTLALGQAWAKGKLQGDEILQLAERGVPVWDVLAKATGKNTAELQKMSEAGELGRSTILKLIDALGQVNAGASEKLMATFSGAVSNAKDALAEFYDMVAKAGVLEFLTGQLQDLLAEFDRMKQSGELQSEAKRLADSFVAFGEGVRTAVEAVNALSGTIKLGVEVWAAWRLAGMTLIPVLAGVGRQAAVTAAETTAMAAASETAAVGMGRLAGAIRLIKGLTLVGLIEGAFSLGMEFFRAKKEAEDLERQVNKMAKAPPENQVAKEIKLVATETEAARFKLTDYQRSLGEMQEQGRTTGDALGEMVKKADLSGVKGVVDMLNGLRSIEQGAMATGQQIQASIQDRLNKMTAGELRDFGIMAKSAFDQGKISAEQLSATLNGQVDAALKGLGSSLEVSAGGMTAKFIEVSQQIGVVEASYDRLKETGQNASAILKAAFEGGLNTAKSIQDMEGLAVSIRQAGEAGRLSQKEVSDFLDTIKTKIDDVKPGVNSLAEAFKVLGMKSPEELKKVAQSAEEAFNVIKNGADVSAAGISNTKEAFKRYAEAAIAANGGVASEMIKAQAWVNGYTVEIDKAGKAMLSVGDSAKEATGGVAVLTDLMQESGAAAADAANEYDGLSNAINKANNASQNTAQVRGVITSPTGQGSNSGGSVSSTNSVDFLAEVLKKGVPKEHAQAVAEEAGRVFSDNNAHGIHSRMIGKFSVGNWQNDVDHAIEKALMLTANSRNGRTTDKTNDSPSFSEVVSQNTESMQRYRADDQQEPQRSAPQQKMIRIVLEAPGNKKTDLYAENQRQVDSFIKTLELAGMVSGR